MTRAQFMLFSLACCLPGFSACSRSEGPEDPVWGKQACAHCAMVVGDRRYAAQALAEDGTRAHFDDVGCMIAYTDEHGTHVRRAWVQDEQSDRWLDVAQARFRRGARTPMDYGFAAGATGELGIEDVRLAVRARGGKQS